MLRSVRIKGFKVFFDEVIFNFGKGKSTKHANVVKSFGKVGVLKSSIIFGANASGKSSFFEIMKHIQTFVCENKVSIHWAEFSMHNNKMDITIEFINGDRNYFYSVGFKLEDFKIILTNEQIASNSTSINNKNIVIKHIKAKLDENGKYVVKRIGAKGINWPNINLENNISIVSQLFAIDENAKIVYQFLKKLEIISLFFIENDKLINESIIKNPRITTLIAKLANPLITKTQRQLIPADPPILATAAYNWNNRKVNFPIMLDSSGTRTLISFSNKIYDAIKNSKTILIDEFDSKLHTFVTKKILKLFNNNVLSNNSAQLIFSSHNFELLSSKLLRSDQVILLEPSINGTKVSRIGELISQAKKASDNSSWVNLYKKGLLVDINIENITPILDSIIQEIERNEMK